jgi:hypothetical protein
MATPLPDRDHRISLADAARIVAARRKADAGKPDAETPFAFNRQGLGLLLAQHGCVGVRAYPAQHDDGSHSWVLVGVGQDGNDLTSGVLLQEPYPCPPFCPDTLLGAGT